MQYFAKRACQIATNDVQGTSKKEMSHFTYSHNLRPIKYVYFVFQVGAVGHEGEGMKRTECKKRNK